MSKSNGKPKKRGRKPFVAYPQILTDKAIKTRQRADKTRSIPPWLWQRRFLTEMCKMPNVARACRLSRVSTPTVYKLRQVDARFAKAWDQAVQIGGQGLEESVWKRAVKSSDVLAIFLLKAHFPDKYRENMQVQHAGPGGGPIQHRFEVVVTTCPERVITDVESKVVPTNGDSA